MKVILLVTLSINVLFAQTHSHHGDSCDDCAVPPVIEKFGMINLDDLRVFYEDIEQKHVQNSPCRNNSYTNSEAMNKWISDKYNNHQFKNETKIHGVTLKDEHPEMIEIFKYLTDVELNSRYLMNMGQQKSFKVPSNCHKVQCALETILKDENKASRWLYLMGRYKVNVTDIPFQYVSRWKNSELDNIIESFDDLPEFMFPVDESDRYTKLTHFDRDENLKGNQRNVIANASMEVFLPYDQLLNNELRQYTMIHELGHRMSHKLDLDNSQEWQEIGGWVERNGEWTMTNSDEAVSIYSTTNPSEDFAETFSYYRYHPQYLKKRNPKKYQFMKEKVFLGIEYTSSKKCQESQSIYAKAYKNAQEVIANKKEERPLALLTDASTCETSLLAYLFENENTGKNEKNLEQCVMSSKNALNLDEVFELMPNLTKDQKRALMAISDWPKREMAQEFAKDYLRSLKASFQNQVIDVLQRTINKSYLSFDDDNREKYCEHVSNISYIEYKFLDNLKKSMAFFNSNLLSQFTKDACMEIGSNTGFFSRDNFKREDIRKWYLQRLSE